MYKIESIRKIEKNLKELFPGETRYIGRLSEGIAFLYARQAEVAIAESKLSKANDILFRGFVNFFKLLWKNLTKSNSLAECQQEFFDKYISYTQGLYGVLSATMLFIKEAEGVNKNNISTGHSTKKFLESCLSQGVIDKSTFNLLYQTTVIRSLVSDHIQEGLMTWGTVSFNTIGRRKNKIFETPPEYAYMYTIIIWPMKSFDELKKDVQEQLKKLFFTDIPMPSFFCPHFSHITQAYMNLLIKLAESKK
jgi:hypothetical protein